MYVSPSLSLSLCDGVRIHVAREPETWRCRETKLRGSAGVVCFSSFGSLDIPYSGAF